MKVQEKGEPVHTWWVQQFCDIFGKKGDVWHMILVDNPAGYSFVLRDLVLIEFSVHASPWSGKGITLLGRGGDHVILK